MKIPEPFRFPASITDPEKIMDCLTDDQQNAVNEYVGAGIAAYYRDMMNELDRLEKELTYAKATIRQQHRIISDLLQRFPVVHLAGGIDHQAGMN